MNKLQVYKSYESQIEEWKTLVSLGFQGTTVSWVFPLPHWLSFLWLLCSFLSPGSLKPLSLDFLSPIKTQIIKDICLWFWKMRTFMELIIFFWYRKIWAGQWNPGQVNFEEVGMKLKFFFQSLVLFKETWSIKSSQEFIFGLNIWSEFWQFLTIEQIHRVSNMPVSSLRRMKVNIIWVQIR